MLSQTLRKASTDMREPSLRSLFKEGRALGWLTNIIREEIFGHGLYGDHPKPQSDWLLSADEFTAALKAILDRYRNTPAVELMRVPDLLNLLYAWRQADYPDEAREWVEKQTATDEGLLVFLSHVRSWMNVNGVQFYPLKRRDLENFLDFELAMRRLQVIALDNQASSAQRALASELLTAAKQGDDSSL